MEILVIIGLILLLLVLWIISVQRKFAVMDGNIQNAMNQIGVQISSRFDALFAVLDLMKGYAADDIQPLMERAAARRSVITARSAPEEVSEQEQVIEETVKASVWQQNAIHCSAQIKTIPNVWMRWNVMGAWYIPAV